MNEYTYQIIGEAPAQIILRSDGACIPVDPTNSDYKAYLESLNDNTETE